MESKTCIFIVLLIMAVNMPLFADFDVRTSDRKESDPEVVYNPTDKEYFVVWVENKKIWGKRLNEDGTKKENAFKIYDAGRTPRIAYNPVTNDYLVVCVANGVRGKIVTGATPAATDESLALHGVCPEIVYNSMANEYLLCYYKLNATYPNIYTRRITKTGVTHSSGPYGITQGGDSTCALAYAPITVNAATPSGKFIVMTAPGEYTTLNSNGQKMEYYNIDAGNSTTSRDPLDDFHVDVAYGIVSDWYHPNSTDTVFAFVWGDDDNVWPWDESTVVVGAWCACIDVKTDGCGDVYCSAFPIDDGSYWRYGLDGILPRIEYCESSQTFMVAWRESPSNDARNAVKVNHIRGTTVYDYWVEGSKVPDAVISRTNGNEDPARPAIAVNSTAGTALVIWEDSRDFATNDVDLYGGFFDAVIPATTSYRYNFGGHVYDGDKPDKSASLASVPIKLYGDNNNDPTDSPGDLIVSDNTNSFGDFYVHSGSATKQYNYYHVMVVNLSGYFSTGAEVNNTTGVVTNDSCITYTSSAMTVGNTYDDNLFWSKTGGMSPCTFSGYVYEGFDPDKSLPISSVSVEVFGDVNNDPFDDIGTSIDATTTDATGAFTLTVNQVFSYYHVAEFDAPGYISSSSAVDPPGSVVDENIVTYTAADLTPGSSYGGICFWDHQSSSVESDETGLPHEFCLYPNHPNPFNPSTRITFTLPQKSPVRLNVYNVQGVLIKRLVERTEESGVFSVTWDGTDTNGKTVPSGIYLCTMKASGFQQTIRMLLLK